MIIQLFKMVCETQTRVIEATQDVQVLFVASEAPIEEVANLGDKMALPNNHIR